MNENKTVPTDQPVNDFLSNLEDEQQVADSLVLIEMMHEITGEPAVMWGSAIIGFGKAHYKYESGREGDIPKLSFSPRKGKLSLYITYWPEKYKKQLDEMGKYSHSKACIYIKSLRDVDTIKLHDVMRKMYRDNEAVTSDQSVLS